MIFMIGAVGMFLFMIGDWLLDAAGAGDCEIGLIVHSNWPNMSMWRFQASATLALVALLPVFFASNEAIQMIRKNASLYETKLGSFWGNAFCLGHILLLTYGIGFHIILCLFPMIYKTLLSKGADAGIAAESVNNSCTYVVALLIILYMICDIGVSVGWYYMIFKRKLNLSKWALFCCPLSTLLIDFPLKMIPLQFFKDFTVAFESLGWMLMYLALAAHAGRAQEKSLRG